MCGIFGLVLLQNPNDNYLYRTIINGLIQLQNRGYDSAGLCAINKDNTQFEVHKYASTNEINAIDKLISLNLKSSDNMYIGFGHNRWATHGIKNDINSHPHLSNLGNFAVVHNGIIENYNVIKKYLISNGFSFKSQTDTEVIVNLIEFKYKINGNIYDAIKSSLEILTGTYGLIIQSIFEPNVLYCVRNGSPLLVGQNEDKIIITSEQSGFCGMIPNYITLHNDDICIITRDNNMLTVKTKQSYKGKNVTIFESELYPAPFQHWTLKEIYQQSEVVLNSINKGGRIKNESEVKLGGLEHHIDILKSVNNIILLGCGTSYFAGLYGMYYFKHLCNFNTIQVFDGAEFDEYDIPKIGITAVILITQSGETKDLHRCIEISKKHNLITIGIVNVVDSLISREVDCGIYCNAGKEVGVASTKSFTSQVICLSMAAIWFSSIHGVNKQKRTKMISDLHNLSNDIQMTLDSCNKISDIAKLFKANNMFILGKGTDEFIAKEGALKVKEISYIHSEGYSSGSLKHGPFALLDENFPVIILNLDQIHSNKTMNCFQEVSSRNADIIFITNNSGMPSCDFSISKHILVPENKSYASLLGIIPIQLFAYYLSVSRGINPDKPKNLAKVVTVE
jgi:glucosamine--fructose-6-phosphate aminotransferase (isomerizing)